MTTVLLADPAGIAQAAALLRAGALVAFGTETVYGLGANARDDAAVASIFAAKQRPRFNPLICHYPEAASAMRDARFDARAARTAAAFWPGPLTLVLPRQTACTVSLLASAGLDTMAVRVPDGPATRALLEAAGVPVAAPSANRSGHVSPTTVDHVLDELGGHIAAILDQGPCSVGIESTVLDMTDAIPVLLRPGGVSREALEDVLGPIRLANAAVASNTLAGLRSPGMLRSHYAPELPVRLDATAVGADEALLAFGPPLPGAGLVFQLSEAADVAEAATRLFAGLRTLDAQGSRRGLVRIAAMPIPRAGLGDAIQDRLERASAPRGT